MKETNSNEVVFFNEPSLNLKAIIAIDNRILGPALATCRIYNFESIEKATRTALSMAYHNTFRSALLKKGFGGGGIVLIGNQSKIKNEMYLRTLGIFINKLQGKILLARSASISYKDMLDVKRETKYILGINDEYIKSGNSPVEAVARSMIWGIKAAVKSKFGSESIDGLSFAVQGVGDVGHSFVKQLLKYDTKITVTDKVYDKIKIIQDKVPNIKVVRPNEIYKQQVDIFVSCAFNNYISKEDVMQLNCKILTGSINSVLRTKELAELAVKRNILYIPGYVISGGEMMQLSNEYENKNPDLLEDELSEIYNITYNLINEAELQNKLINEVALNTAKKYVEDVAAIKMLK